MTASTGSTSATREYDDIGKEVLVSKRDRVQNSDQELRDGGGDMSSAIQPYWSKSAWTARDMADPGTWTHRLSEAEIAEIDAALRRLQAHDLGIPDITREAFPLDR